jgi:uncharacterized repeat protein (TIGR01451 family)
MMAELRRLIVLLALGCAVIATARSADAGVVGGTTITNVATATYASSTGTTFMSASNTVSSVIASIGAITVSPKEPAANPAVDSFPAGSVVTRTFTIANSSNISDAYTITALTATAGKIGSVAFVEPGGNIAVTLGSTVSPTIVPGATIQVVVTLATTGVPIGTQIAIDLTARTTVTTTANGLQSASGQAWAVAALGPQLAGPVGGTSPIEKYVQNTVASSAMPGSTVTYSIQFQNDGGAPATNAVLTDTVPTGMSAQLATVAVNGTLAGSKATLSGQSLVVQLGTVAAGMKENITFSGVVSPQVVDGTSLVNIANVTADGINATATQPAVVLVGFSNIVYDGYDGQKHPIGGAKVELVEDATQQPLVLATPVPGTLPIGGSGVNLSNANPMITSPDGVYAFYFTQAQLNHASSSSSTRQISSLSGIDLIVTAPNYTTRRIGVTLSSSSASSLLYDATLISKDGMPLAAAGAFTLVETGVTLDNVFGILGNIPLFAPHPITITKTADQTDVSAGDRVVFTLSFQNTGKIALGQASVVDTLPSGLAYAAGTALVDGKHVEPVVNGRTLTWTFPTLDANAHTIVYATVVVPGAVANTILTNTVVLKALPESSTVPVSATAQAQLTVVNGALTEELIITGRVYADPSGAGHFHKGDSGVAGVRIYLEDGTSVVTDPNGRYSFPSVKPGMHALRLDATTLPKSYTLFRERGDDDRAAQRLVHGIMDAYIIQDVNFAVAPVTK